MSNITVADLSAKHIGQKVIITDGDENSYVGVIENLEFETVDARSMVAEYINVTGVIVVFRQARITFPLNAEVEVRS